MAELGRQGHDVHLLTLTRGGATRQRHKLGLSVAEMGEVRYREMQCVGDALGLAGMTVLDLPDSGLAGIDPRIIEREVRTGIERVSPDVVVTYPVHGISGFHDHLVAHAVVKRVFCEMRGDSGGPRRLAFTAITEEDAARMTLFSLTGAKPEDIDCLMTVDESSIHANQAALDCYVTYRETVDKSGIRGFIGGDAAFEFFDEAFTPPVAGLFDRLP